MTLNNEWYTYKHTCYHIPEYLVCHSLPFQSKHSSSLHILTTHQIRGQSRHLLHQFYKMTKEPKTLINNSYTFFMYGYTSGAFILGVPAGSCIAILCHISDVIRELSPSTQSKFMSPCTQQSLFPSGQVHMRGLLHWQFCCTKMLDTEKFPYN